VRNGGTERLGHRSLGTNHVPGFLRGQQRLEVGIDFGNIVGKPVFELHLVGCSRAPYGNLESIREVQRVVDGADRAKLDCSAAEPVQDPARKLVVAECAAIVEADIPGSWSWPNVPQ